LKPTFSFFGALAALASYRDVWVLASATVVVTGDHVLSRMVEAVVDGVHPVPLGWVQFMGGVLFEDTLLSLWIWESLRLMRNVASHQAEQTSPARENRTGNGREHLELVHQENVK